MQYNEHSSNGSQLLRLLESIGQEPLPEQAIINLLDGVSKFAAAKYARLFFLDMAKSAFVCQCQIGYTDVAPSISVDVLNTRVPQSITDEVILSNQCKRVPDVTRIVNLSLGRKQSSDVISRLLIPISRSGRCYGFIDLESDIYDHFTHMHQEFAMSVAAASILLFEKQRTLDLLRALQQPINFYQSFENYMEDLNYLLYSASGMPYIALREYEKESVRYGGQSALICLAQVGFEEYEKTALDMSPISAKFQEGLDAQIPIVIPDIDQDDVSDIKNWLDHLGKPIMSFVIVPIKVSDGVFGTISFAASCRYEYSPLEIAGFESVANGIGVSITNYRNFREKEHDVIAGIKSTTPITATEVAEAIRHQAKTHLESAIVLAKLINTYAQHNAQANSTKITDKSNELLLVVEDIRQSLLRLKDVTRPPRRSKEVCKLKSLWEQSFQSLQGRLDREQISYRVTGKDIEVSVYPDYLLHAFLNLIINSMDAFSTNSKRINRSIVVAIETPSEASNSIKMTYTDNASGIDVSKLSMPDAEDNKRVEHIFEAGVTSKKEGSGFGLYLVRSIFTQHKGSIRLTSHRNGVQFEMSIPKL